MNGRINFIMLAGMLSIGMASQGFSSDLLQEQKLAMLTQPTQPKPPSFPEQSNTFDVQLINWIKNNVSAETGLPLSFDISEQSKPGIYERMGKADSVDGIIERVIVEEGLVVYDGAVGQIVLTMIGGRDNLTRAFLPVKVYWEGHLGELANLRAGFPQNLFIYDPDNPQAVSSDVNAKGRRGFVFRIINANGKYNTADPLDGKRHVENFPTWPTVHWEDWKPVAGENAWIVMAALHLYHKKYFDPFRNRYIPNPQAVELKLAEEIARAALLLQSETGGIRMAPMGTYREGEDRHSGEWWYRQISTENNLSWYAAFRMLYQITGKNEYREALKGIELYLHTVYNEEGRYFYQGMHEEDGRWLANDEHFALDVQTWGIAVLGAEKIDQWLGDGAAYRIWQTAKTSSGVRDTSGNLLGVGFSCEKDRVSVEWTAGAILAAMELKHFYAVSHPEWARETLADAGEMRRGIEGLRRNLDPSTAAYSYSSRRGWIPFGWNSHDPEVLSLASTGWVVFVDHGFNPFFLSQTARPVLSLRP